MNPLKQNKNQNKNLNKSINKNHNKLNRLSALFFGVSLLALGCAETSPPSHLAQSEQANQPIITSPYDTREYRALTLDNGLQVLLVSDPQTEKAAASLAVGVGSMQNPDEQLGLAHFLEHMLFLGTEKYPGSDEYGDFMARHNGMHNAYTADDHTNYMFEINNSALPEALDRFSDFFKAPLFTPEYVNKEVNAVHSEWSMQRANDGYVLFALNNLTLNPAHPISRFRIGNNESLGDKENSELLPTMLAFYQQYYSANLMTAAIAGKQSLDELEQLARGAFSDIPNFNAEVAPITAAPVTPEYSQKIIYYKPQVETREIIIDFTLPDLTDAFKSKPAELVSYIIASEMPGTPVAMLREAGLIESVSAWGESNNYGNAGRLRVHVSFTEPGYAQKEVVLGLLFRYFDAIRTEGIHEGYVNELRTVLQNDFQFLRKQGAFQYVADLAATLQEKPVEHVIDGDYRLDAFDPEKTELVLSALKPSHARIFVMGPDVETNQSMHYFAGEYRVEDLTDETIAQWEALVADIPVQLPAVNRFLPEDLSVVTVQQTQPAIQTLAPGIELLFQQSEAFDEPRAEVKVAFYQPLYQADWADRVAAQLLVDAFNLTQRGFLREAAIAGVRVGLQLEQGLQLSLSGFNDKQAEVAQHILSRFAAYEPTPEQIEQSRDRMRRQIENTQKERPVSRLFPKFSQLSGAEYHGAAERLAVVQNITSEQVKAMRDRLLGKARVRAFVYGNYEQAQAVALTKQVATFVQPDAQLTYQAHRPMRAVADFPVSSQEETHLSDTGILEGYIVQQDDLASQLLLRILDDLVHNRFFNQLRTEEQLGYAVGSTVLPLNTFRGLGFYVQSPVRGPADLSARIQTFMDDFENHLSELSEARFEESKASLRSSLIQPPQNLAEEATRVYREWTSEQPIYDRVERSLALLETLHKADALALFKALRADDALRFRIEVRGNDFADTPFANSEGWKVYTD